MLVMEQIMETEVSYNNPILENQGKVKIVGGTITMYQAER